MESYEEETLLHLRNVEFDHCSLPRHDFHVHPENVRIADWSDGPTEDWVCSLAAHMLS